MVTGAGAVLGQGIVKALQRSTLDCRIVTADPSPLSSALYWADRAYTVPFASDPNYLDRFSEILAQESPDMVLVGTDVELPLFAEHRHSLEERFNTHILVSNPRVVAIADDKYLTQEFLTECDLNPLATALPEDGDALAALIEKVGFPLIVKPRIGARSAGVSLVQSDLELRETLKGRSGLMVQECAGEPDTEYTASALVFDGNAHASIVMRRDLRDGNTYRAYADAYEDLNAFVRKVGEALQPYGPANFQFRIDSAGQPRIFEINGRFSGATPLRALVGFNEVEMCIRKILFGEQIVEPEIRHGTILRHLSEQFVSAEQLSQVQ